MEININKLETSNKCKTINSNLNILEITKYYKQTEPKDEPTW